MRITPHADGRNLVGQQLPTWLAQNVASVYTWLKVWPVPNFARQVSTTRSNRQQGVQMDATCTIQQCCELLANNIASVCRGKGGGFSWAVSGEDATNETLGRPCQSLTEMNCFCIALKLAFSLRKSIHGMKTCLAKLSFESAYVKIWREDSKEPSLPDLLQLTTCCEVFSKLWNSSVFTLDRAFLLWPKVTCVSSGCS